MNALGSQVEKAWISQRLDLFPEDRTTIGSPGATIHSEKLNSEYLFCTTAGNQLNYANLSNRVWRPALEKAEIPFRPMIQTRHSFATTALSLGENPLWIAHVMGHRDTDMIIRVYAKFVNDAANRDGCALNDIYCKTIGNKE